MCHATGPSYGTPSNSKGGYVYSATDASTMTTCQLHTTLQGMSSSGFMTKSFMCLLIICSLFPKTWIHVLLVHLYNCIRQSNWDQQNVTTSMNWLLCGLGFSGAKNVYFVSAFTAFGENGKHIFLVLLWYLWGGKCRSTSVIIHVHNMSALQQDW